MDWYEKNRDRILAKKREQYQANEARREKKRAAALARYYRVREELTRQASCPPPLH